MESQSCDHEALLTRLRNLEKWNHNLHRAMWLAVLAAAAALVLVCLQTTSRRTVVAAGPRVLEAEKIVITDGGGNQRVVLWADEFGALMSFSAREGKSRLVLGVMDAIGGVPTLSLLDGESKAQAMLHMPKGANTGALLLRDKDGMERVRLGALNPQLQLLGPAKRAPGLFIRHPSSAEIAMSFIEPTEASRWVVPVPPGQTHATPYIRLTDQKNRPRLELALVRGWHPMLALHDAEGHKRALLAMRREGPSLMLADPGNRVRAILLAERARSADGDGDVGLRLLDSQGRSRAVVGSYGKTITSEGPLKGTTYGPPPSSIHLFDENGELLWRAPEGIPH